jgi:hypothetical protein
MKLIRQNAKSACIFLTFLMLSITVPYQSVLAAMIGTEATLDLTRAQQARDDINSLLLREDVQNALMAQGINPLEAKARIDSLSDAEVIRIADEIDKLPTGGNIQPFPTWVGILIIAAVVAILVLFFTGVYYLGKYIDEKSDSPEVLKKQIQTKGYVVKSKIQPQATDQPQEKPKLASIPKDAPVVRVSLRREPTEVSNRSDISAMLVEYNFFELSRNTGGSFVNDFVDNKDGTVTDRATGVMWQESGSLERLDNRGANKYVEQLNSKHFAGYSDWRMPTIEELASLLARNRNKGAHIAPVFDNHQTSCWSADKFDWRRRLFDRKWIVNFKQGQVLEAVFFKPSMYRNYATSTKNETNYVKAVRTVK